MEEIKFILGIVGSLLILYVTFAHASKLIRDYRLIRPGGQTGLGIDKGLSRPKKGTPKQKAETRAESRPSGSAHKHVLP